MPTVLSSKLRHTNINNFLSTADNESVYFAVSKPSAWSDETTPPTPYDSYNLQYDVFREMLYLKRITSSDCINVITYNPWVENNRYQCYDDTREISDLSSTINDDLYGAGSYEYKPFYIITDSYNVYKCIDNNNGVESTVKPTSASYGTSTDTYTPLSDGYVWMYMFTLQPSEANKFLTTNWVPVKTLKEDDTSTQWDVQTNAVNGGIYRLNVVSSGSGYTKTVSSSSFTAGSSTMTSVVGITDGSSSNDYYNNSTLYVLENSTGIILGIGIVSDYDGATKTATVSSLGSFTLNSGTQSIFIVPTVTISGDGTNAKAAAIVDTGADEVIGFQIVNPGSGYSYATVTITDAIGGGSNASANAVLAPVNGHGSDPVIELGASALMLKVQFDGDEDGEIIDTNEYRKISIVHNPIFENSYYQTSTAASGTITLNISHDISDTGAYWFPTAGKKIVILKGKGVGQIRTIASNVSRVVTLTENWDIIPDTTSYYGIISAETILNQCVVLTINGSVTNGPFVQDSTVTQATSGATGEVVKHDVANGLLYLTNITGAFDGTHNVSAGSVACSINDVTQPSIKRNYGEVIYLENRRPLSRYADQIEDIKVIIEF